jgi:hypothetical protein
VQTEFLNNEAAEFSKGYKGKGRGVVGKHSTSLSKMFSNLFVRFAPAICFNLHRLGFVESWVRQGQVMRAYTSCMQACSLHKVFLGFMQLHGVSQTSPRISKLLGGICQNTHLDMLTRSCKPEIFQEIILLSRAFQSLDPFGMLFL